MNESEARNSSPVGRAHVLLLAFLAYVPLLLSAPGRVAADTKLYLYLDPGRLISDSIWSWDARQLGGWVPHQNVGYLWPTGPFYAFFDWIGCPDWVAQRLWLGSLLFVAGLGARRLARTLDQPMLVAGLVGVLYQLSPYVLPYISRTSALLLPWSLLPWIVHTVIGYARSGDRRQLGIFGLLILSTGGLNATALLMIAPAPIIFFVHEVRARGRRALVGGLAALGGLSLAVSAWWITGLAVQGKYGAAVLSYSEALPSTAATSTSTEVLRGLGYWLSYDRNGVVELTSAAEPYQGNFLVMSAGVSVLVLGLIGLVRAPIRIRRPLLLTLAAGLVLAVGAHPFDDPSPLWRLAVDHPTSALSLALRSSTRAVPLVVLALALGAARMIDSLVRKRPRIPAGVPSAVVATALTTLLALVNLPALVGGRLIDPDVSRPESIPTAWHEAADYLDRRFDDGLTGSVLLLPGAESAAYRWGYTVDPILPGLTRKPLITRDWLPLGSAPFDDLLYALDDAFQEGRARPEMIAPVARLLGADTVMVVNSWQYERFGTVRPERTVAMIGDESPDLVRVAEFGPPSINLDPRPDAVDDRDAFPPSALPEIVLYEVRGASSPTRLAESPTVVLGDGTGTVDLAAAGVIDGTQVMVPLAGVPKDERAAVVHRAPLVIVTDSNRRRAHHWRGSQEVWGATEPITGVVSRVDLFDQRLPVFPSATIDDQTIVREEAIEAVATSYGTELRYWPEHRPTMALDGDDSTAWTTTGRGSPIGEVLTISSTEKPLDELRVLLPVDSVENRITRIDVRVDGGTWTSTDIGPDATAAPGQSVALTAPAHRVDIRIAAVSDPRAKSPVGFAEVLPVDLRRPEIVRVPLTPAGAADKTTFVFTRLIADPFDDWRRDPEREIDREFQVPAEASFPLTIEARIVGSWSTPDRCIEDLLTLDGRPVPLRVLETTGDRARFAPCDGDIVLPSGDHVLETHARGAGLAVDRVTIGRFPTTASTSLVTATTSGRIHRTATLPSCNGDCWLETADGWNVGWRASLDDSSLADPIPSFGGRNLWHLDGSEENARFDAQWQPQRVIWAGLAITVIAVLACGALVLSRRRHTRVESTEPSDLREVRPFYPALAVGLIVAPLWGVITLLAALATSRVSRRFGRPALQILGSALIGVSLFFLFAQQIRTGAEPGFGWPSVFEKSHRPLLAGVLLLIAGSWSTAPRDNLQKS